MIVSKVMIALGGNALGNSPKEQLELVKETAKPIVDLIEAGHIVVLAHGNGPQVGMINSALETAASVDNRIPEMPFPECGAMSQGYIGYHLQNAIAFELKNRNINKSVVSVVTQVIVDENDEAFKKPSKPIGGFFSKEEADELVIKKGYTMVEDSGRGYRRVVPSPKPVDIVEKDVINDIVNSGHIVIAVGGGGIPTVRKGNALIGIPAVIDKDLASQKLAELLDCDTLFILTAVEKIAINFGKPNQVNLDRITVGEALKYIDEGHFAPGSMLPKVEAAIDFVQSKEGRTAVISSLENAKKAISGETGTTIYR
ncbi:carbamate kinase [Proteiniborus ethanoligenes]|uniref:carbamate kinase n=1 Tax=Proteiniborus ethanoligenes TaxID=415015 RepID=UPI0031389F11